MRLSCATLEIVSPEVAHWGYDRATQRRGIVHLGIGAFHRAHQAVYTDAAMAAGDRDWSITGVSLRSPEMRDRLAPQDGLYTVTEHGESGEPVRVIGAVSEVLVAREDSAAVTSALADPATRIVSLTVTEKAYCRRTDGALDVDAVRADPGSLYHHLASGFRTRMAAGVGGQTIVCCDNLADNGRLLAALIAEWLEADASDVARWFARECACPSTMVDRIVPATSAADIADVAYRIGVEDEAAIVTEPFRQWVIEDRFAGPRPRWEGGAQ